MDSVPGKTLKVSTGLTGDSSSRYFKPLDGNLAQSSARGGASLLISEAGCNAFRLLGIIILARLLMPEHFGLIGMVTAFSAVVELYKDLGFATVTVKEREITHEQVSTLFWVNAGIGFALSAVFAGAAPIISWFYADPRLLWIILAIAPSFLFGGLTVQHQALLRRNMKFSQLAVIQLAATGLSILISIVLAWEGFGYWSLVWREIIRPVVSAVGVWSMCHWLPGVPRFASDFKRLFQAGSHVTGFNILVFGSKSLDQILLGKVWGAAPVGLYKQAGVFLQLQNSLVTFPVTYVMTSALSVLQGDRVKYATYYKEAVSLLAFCQMPLAIFMVVYSESIVSVCLGQKWMPASLLLKILAAGSIFEAVASTTGIVMITNHKTREYLVLGAINSVAIIAGMLIGVNWGAVGIAAAIVMVSYVSFPFTVWYALKGTCVPPRQLYEAIVQPLSASIILGACLLVIQRFVGGGGGVGELVCSAVLAPAVYCGIWIMFPGGSQKLLGYLFKMRSTVEDLLARLRSQTTGVQEA